MKKLFFVLFIMYLTIGLSACVCDDGRNVDLIFANDSSSLISHVSIKSEWQSGGTQNADSSPLERGETFGFEVGQYPVTMTVYGTPAGEAGEVVLGRITVSEAPPEEERWYVTARDGEYGLTLTANIRRSEEGRLHDRRAVFYAIL